MICQLFSRRDDEDEGSVGTSIFPMSSRGFWGLLDGQDLLEDGDEEGQGFAVARLRGQEARLPGQDLRDGLLLDAGRHLEAVAVEGLQNPAQGEEREQKINI